MSYRHTIKRYITVKVNGEEKQVEELFEALRGMLSSPTCSWDMEWELTTNDYKYTIQGVEVGTETVYPGCYTLSNGDPGYPDEYDDDLTLCEETIEEYISEFINANNYEFDYSVCQEDESADYLDY